MKKFIRNLLLSSIFISGINLLNLGAAYAAPPPLYNGWTVTGGPTYLGNTNSIYFNSANDIGGVKSSMRSSYSYTDRRTRVLGYRLMQTLIYPTMSDGNELDIHKFTDIMHPDGRLGYTEWFDSPYGVYLDYQASRLPIKTAPRNLTLENTIVNETINYNKGINNTSQFAIVSSSDSNGELGDAKGASMLLRKGTINGGMYLSSSTTVDSNVKAELKSRGVKTVYISGGFQRFNNDALFNDGFNIIRIGGINRQHTLDLSYNMPNQSKNPPRKFGNVSNGLIIEGIPSGTAKYNEVFSYLTNLNNTHNMDYLKQAFNYLISSGNIGDTNNVRTDSAPIITIGVNNNGFETYCSIYGNKVGNSYIYNVVVPGYFVNPDVKSNEVSVSNYDYHVNGSKDYWVRLNDSFRVSSKSSINSSVFSNLYPTNETYLSSGIDYKIGVNSSNGLYYMNNPSNHFKEFSLASAKRYPSGGRNYTETSIDMKAIVDNMDYKVGMYSLLANGSSVWPGGYLSNNEYVKTDGSPPKSDYIPLTKLNNINSLYIYQQGIYDTRSGLVVDSPYAYVYIDGSGVKGVKIPLTKSASYYDYYNTLDLSSHLGARYGNMRVEVWARDNVGNEGIVKSYIIDRPAPGPNTSELIIKNYEYEDSTTKWVQADNEFLVLQKGFGIGVNPTGSRITIGDNPTDGESDVTYSTTMHTSDYWNMAGNNPNIDRSKNNYLEFLTSGSDIYATGNHYLQAGANLNGKKFHALGRTETTTGGTLYTGSWIKDSKMLGIDGMPPNITYVKTGRDEIEITATDAESGLKQTDITLSDGTKITNTNSKFKVTLNGSANTTILSVDNVGNSKSITVGDIRTVVTSNITTSVIEVSDKKMLKVTATGNVVNPVPGKVMTWRLKGVGDGITNSIMHSATGGSYSYTQNIADIYNTPAKPSLTNTPDKDSNAFVTIVPLSDINKHYDFTLEEKYDYESSWIAESSKSADFASGRKEYKYQLTKVSDKEFKPVTPILVRDSSITGHTISLNSLVTGDYKLKVTMYDYNGNPSGTAELDIHHVQPLEHTELEGDVTAVKDIAWESESYPIDFLDTSKFPLGEAYKFNDNGIKLGYGINFRFKIPTEQSVGSYLVEYKYYSSDGSPLVGSSNNKSFADSDSSDGSNYNSQSSNFTVNSGSVYVKHFTPADATFKLTNGSSYNGTVKVNVKMTFIRGAVSTSKTFDLYTVITDKTAFDDLNLDKQR